MRSLFFLPFSIAAIAADVTTVSTPDGGAVPDAEVAADGAVHVAFMKGRNVFHATSRDSGKTWSTPLKVNSATDTGHPAHSFRGPDVALGGDGDVHVVWYPGNPYVGVKTDGGIRYARLPKGATAFEPERNLNRIPSENFSIAVAPGGKVSTVATAKGIALQDSADAGKTFAAPARLEIADNCECCATRAIFLSDGALALAYRTKENNQRDMFLAIRRDGSWKQERISGTPWNITGCPMSGTYLAPTRDGMIMAIETQGAISWAELDKNGHKLSETTVPGANGKYPVALRAPDGTTCVSWKNSAILEWQVFKPDGKADGKIQSRPSKSTRHAGTVTKDGNFLLVD